MSVLSEEGEGEGGSRFAARRGDFDFERWTNSLYLDNASLRSDSFLAIRKSSRSSRSIDSVPVAGDDTIICEIKYKHILFYCAPEYIHVLLTLTLIKKRTLIISVLIVSPMAQWLLGFVAGHCKVNDLL